MSLIGCSACSGSQRAPASGVQPGVVAIPQDPEPPDPEPPDPEPPDPEPPEPIRLSRPPFERFVADDIAAPAGAGAKLVVVSKQRNQITDDDRWFRTHDLALPVEHAPSGPQGADAPMYRGVPLAFVIQGSPRLLVHQSPHVPDTYLVGVDPASGRHLFAFDFTAYATPPHITPGDEAFVRMDLEWAAVDGDRLYVSHAHRTYASSSGGANAYVTALRIPDGALLWRSQPLVSNARNFALVRDPQGTMLVTGYGFTAEPDFLYLLDPASGAVIDRTALRTGPSYIIPKGDIIHVRTYDHDYQLRLKRAPPAR